MMLRWITSIVDHMEQDDSHFSSHPRLSGVRTEIDPRTMDMPVEVTSAAVSNLASVGSAQTQAGDVATYAVSECEIGIGKIIAHVDRSTDEGATVKTIIKLFRKSARRNVHSLQPYWEKTSDKSLIDTCSIRATCTWAEQGRREIQVIRSLAWSRAINWRD